MLAVITFTKLNDLLVPNMHKWTNNQVEGRKIEQGKNDSFFRFVGLAFFNSTKSESNSKYKDNGNKCLDKLFLQRTKFL